MPRCSPMDASAPSSACTSLPTTSPSSPYSSEKAIAGSLTRRHLFHSMRRPWPRRRPNRSVAEVHRRQPRSEQERRSAPCLKDASKRDLVTAADGYGDSGYPVPVWPNGVDQVPAIVGSIVRTEPHSGGADRIDRHAISGHEKGKSSHQRP